MHVLEEERDYARISFGGHGAGYVHLRHLAPLDSLEPDHVAVAERFLHVPYLWGRTDFAGARLLGSGATCPRRRRHPGASRCRYAGIGCRRGPDAGFWPRCAGRAARSGAIWSSGGGMSGIIGDDGMLIPPPTAIHMAVAARALSRRRYSASARNSYGPVTAIRRPSRPKPVQNAPR